MRNVSNKICRENINTNFTHILSNCFPESRSVSMVMWIKQHRIRCCVSLVRMVTRTRHSARLHVHCLSCVLSSYIQNMLECDPQRDTSGNFLRDLGELSEHSLLIDAWHQAITVNRPAPWWLFFVINQIWWVYVIIDILSLMRFEFLTALCGLKWRESSKRCRVMR
jgi:hypothetical protein